MSADDNLRDALIEALITNIHEQAHRDGDYVRQVDDGLQFDGTMYVAELADAALSVVKDWTADDWRPIETAPKDQSAVLLGYFHENVDGSIYEEGGGPIVGRWIKDGWSTPHTKLNSSGLFSPTHWMPVPSKPDHF